MDMQAAPIRQRIDISMLKRAPNFARRHVRLLGVAAFIGLAAIFLLLSHPSASAHTPTDVVAVSDISDQATAQGAIEAKSYTDVGAQVSGQIDKFYVQMNDPVKAGTLLTTLDPRLYQSKLDGDSAHLRTLQAEQNLQQANLVLAKQTADRNHRLASDNAIAQAVVEQGDAALATARASIAAAAADIAEQRDAIATDKTNLA